MVENILPHCGCDFREDRITDRVFQCFPSSPQSVTYHAQLHGTLNANASELIRDIEDWVSTGVTVSIQLLPLIVSSVCAVSPHAPIQQCQAQLGTPEDNILDETSSQTSSPEVTFNSIPVTASATVLVIIVVAITAITVIVIVHLRNRHSVINSKTTNNTSSNR